jgi:hypothetical protein
MLTLEGFVKGCRANNRRLVLLFALVLFLMAICPLPFVFWFKIDPDLGKEERRFLTILGLIPIFSAIPTLFLGLFLLERRSKREGLIVCPHCKKQLFTFRESVIAKHHCFNCKERVFAEFDDCGEGRIIVEQLNSAQKAFLRRQLQTIGLFILIAFLSLPFLAAKNIWGNIACFTVFAFAMFIAPYGTWKNYSLVRRNSQSSCYHCSRQLVDHYFLVIETRNCYHCGKRVLAEPFDLSSDRVVRDDLKAYAARYQRRSFVLLVLSVGLLVVGCLADAVVLKNNIYLLQLAEQPLWIAVLLLCVPEIPGFLVLFFGSWINHRRIKQDRLFMCPHCDAPLLDAPYLVMTTGNCCNCGRRVLAETEGIRQANSP